MRGRCSKQQCEYEQRLEGRRPSRVALRGQRWEEVGEEMLTDRLERKAGPCEPWNQRTRESNNFGSGLRLLVPNPGAGIS